MTQYGFYVDANLCVGCMTCRVACKDVNNLGVNENFRMVKSYATGQFPNVGMYHVSISCNHCASPACVANCPVGAMSKDPETGLVIHDDELCIGCQTCVSACPYGHPQFIESEGIVRKCEACGGLRVQGEQPSCVASCPMRAIEFGDIEELKAAHADENPVSDFEVLPDSSTTAPNAVWKIKQIMLDSDYDQVVL